MDTIETQRLLLRPLRTTDATDIIRIRSIPEATRYQGWQPTSTEEIASFVAKMTQAGFLAPNQWFQFAILTKDGSQLIGDCGAHPEEDTPQQVEIAVTLDPAYQKNGYAHEAIQALLVHLFGKTDTHRVYASIDPANTPSIHLFEKLDFRKEAHLIQSMWFKGTWADNVIMAILKEEWLQHP